MKIKDWIVRNKIFIGIIIAYFFIPFLNALNSGDFSKEYAFYLMDKLVALFMIFSFIWLVVHILLIAIVSIFKKNISYYARPSAYSFLLVLFVIECGYLYLNYVDNKNLKNAVYSFIALTEGDDKLNQQATTETDQLNSLTVDSDTASFIKLNQILNTVSKKYEADIFWLEMKRKEYKVKFKECLVPASWLTEYGIGQVRDLIADYKMYIAEKVRVYKAFQHDMRSELIKANMNDDKSWSHYENSRLNSDKSFELSIDIEVRMIDALQNLAEFVNLQQSHVSVVDSNLEFDDPAMAGQYQLLLVGYQELVLEWQNIRKQMQDSQDNKIEKLKHLVQ